MSFEAYLTPGRRAVPTGVLARLATTGIYLLRDIPRDLQAGARARAVTEGTTLRRILLGALREYAAGTWTPRPDAAPES
ncbi:MAG TPA: hypothetical protein VMS64_30630 [Candidatus Methylomirabilis sp.]|nr:hypothetical protein [Candidatus Methylomirabilis sp.]